MNRCGLLCAMAQRGMHDKGASAVFFCALRCSTSLSLPAISIRLLPGTAIPTGAVTVQNITPTFQVRRWARWGEVRSGGPSRLHTPVPRQSCPTSGCENVPLPSHAVWCALDDATALNGCLVVVPCSHRRPVQEQQQQQQQQQQQGVPLEVAAGTAIITIDSLLHCSGPNYSNFSRRAWMPQFSSQPLRWQDGGGLVALAVPLEMGGLAAAAGVGGRQGGGVETCDATQLLRCRPG